MLEMQVTEEQLQSIVERAIREADLDGDDAISFEEFRKVKIRTMDNILNMIIWPHNAFKYVHGLVLWLSSN